MKTQASVDRVERRLWQASRAALSAEAGMGGPDWPARVMASVRALGPLPAAQSERVALWPVAVALAASLAVLAAWYAGTELHARALASEVFWNDPAGMTFASLLTEP